MKTLVVPARSLVLVFAGAKNEFFSRCVGVLAFVENHFHLLGDGHLNAVLAGQSESSARSQHSFRNFAAQSGKDLRQFAADSEFVAHGAVAAQGTGAGEYQVADAGKSGKRFAAASAGHGEARDL